MVDAFFIGPEELFARVDAGFELFIRAITSAFRRMLNSFANRRPSKVALPA